MTSPLREVSFVTVGTVGSGTPNVTARDAKPIAMGWKLRGGAKLVKEEMPSRTP